MPVETDADRAVFLDTDEFGVAATYLLAGGGSSVINGIFDDEYTSINGIGFADVTSTAPVFECRTSDIPAGADQGAGDTLTVNSVVWRVVEIQPDGTGMTSLRLSK